MSFCLFSKQNKILLGEVVKCYPLKTWALTFPIEKKRIKTDTSAILDDCLPPKPLDSTPSQDFVSS